MFSDINNVSYIVTQNNIVLTVASYSANIAAPTIVIHNKATLCKIRCVQINLSICHTANLELIKYINNQHVEIAIIHDYDRTNNSFTGLQIGWSKKKSTWCIKKRNTWNYYSKLPTISHKNLIF